MIYGTIATSLIALLIAVLVVLLRFFLTGVVRLRSGARKNAQRHRQLLSR
jgi:ABC-type phosphate transport system permease subunit